ncbi:hypothetical protein [Raoultella terrigena]|uniref:hypothetical protein n=1 Tax=Raoultella terrigena TaxID=577 RepID=UPI00132F9178|nr:hypothetical protein [Raoultella terrigena]
MASFAIECPTMSKKYDSFLSTRCEEKAVAFLCSFCVQKTLILMLAAVRRTQKGIRRPVFWRS